MDAALSAAQTQQHPLHIETLLRDSPEFERELAVRKQASNTPDFAWYPYGTLGNLYHLERLLSDARRDLGALIDGRPVADVGGADGDLAFFLERHGVAAVDLIDYAPT